MTHADLLREAARLMTDRANAANTDEARRPYGDQGYRPVSRDEWGALVNNYLGGVMGTHCASWTPVVALAVAEMLEDQAEYIEATPYPVDPDDIAHYGKVLHEACHSGDDCSCNEQPPVRRQFDKQAEVLLAQLAADGRLLS